VTVTATVTSKTGKAEVEFTGFGRTDCCERLSSFPWRRRACLGTQVCMLGSEDRQFQPGNNCFFAVRGPGQIFIPFNRPFSARCPFTRLQLNTCGPTIASATLSALCHERGSAAQCRQSRIGILPLSAPLPLSFSPPLNLDANSRQSL
jgi:hypothetical protein